MRILIVHAYYRHRGGEDATFEQEADLLEAAGHAVYRFTSHNTQIDERPVRAAASAVWNRHARRDLTAAIRAHRPDVVHVHNTFPSLSPTVLRAAAGEGVPLVATLHNYRLICPNALLFRDGHVCEDCPGRRLAWPGAVHACYRQSRPASAATAAMLATHHVAGTWRQVDLFVTPTEFARQKLIAGGLPAERTMVKPHFLHPDPGPMVGGGGYAAFVGRLSPEKGVEPLLDAWEGWDAPLDLHIAGGGPLEPVVEEAAARNPRVKWLGEVDTSAVGALLGGAAVAVIPSLVYETFGRVVIEALARGTPVIASDHGALREIAGGGRWGRLFRVGDPHALRSAVEGVANDLDSRARRTAARRRFESCYSATRNLELLIEAYDRAIRRR